MLAAGLIDEVRSLRARGDLTPDLPSMRCVGYRQAWTALDEGLYGDALRLAVRERGIAATRQLAKRQLTWLRGMQRKVVACDGDDVLAQVAALVEQWRA
jgi:tRNA dimethylallyltransferase